MPQAVLSELMQRIGQCRLSSRVVPGALLSELTQYLMGGLAAGLVATLLALPLAAVRCLEATSSN